MAKVITKVLVRIGDHDVLFAANKDGVLVPNENGLNVIRDYYGYNKDAKLNCLLENFENLGFLVVNDFFVDFFCECIIIDTKKEGV